jgi:hypothetical protein
MSRLLGQWSVDPALLSVKRMEFTALVNEVGFERANEAVDVVIRQHASTFFPNIAEIRKMVPEPPKREYCGRCIEGFIYADPGDHMKGVRLCPCRGSMRSAS